MVVPSAEAISVPAYNELLWPTLQALTQLGGSAKIQEILDAVIAIERVPEQQQGTLHGKGPQTEISYRLAWARTYLKLVGAVTNSTRGVWAITEYGRTLRNEDMTSIPRRVRAAASPNARRSLRKRSGPEQGPADPEPPLLTFTSTVFDEWRDGLLTTLQILPPPKFERLCQRLLREAGFTQVEVTGRSGDGGIDGIGVLRVALLSFRVFFQCKRYKGSVGPAAIRDFRGAMMGRGDKGLVITTGTFTADAKKEATRDGATVLDLIDGDDLCRLLKEHRLGVTTEQVEAVTIDTSWFEEI